MPKLKPKNQNGKTISWDLAAPISPPDTKPTQQSLPLEEFPKSIEDKIMDLVAENRHSISWCFQAKDARKSDNARQLMVNFCEKLVHLFLETHVLDKHAAAMAFLPEVKKYVDDPHNYLTKQTLLRKNTNIRMYVFGFEKAVDRVINKTPLTADNLHAYLTELNNVFKDESKRRRRRQPTIVAPKEGVGLHG